MERGGEAAEPVPKILTEETESKKVMAELSALRALVEATLCPALKLDDLRAEKEKLEMEIKELQQGTALARKHAECSAVKSEIMLLTKEKGERFEKSLQANIQEVLPEACVEHTGRLTQGGNQGDLQISLGKLLFTVEAKNHKKVTSEKSWLQEAERGRTATRADGALLVVTGVPQKMLEFNSYASRHVVMCGKETWLSGLMLLATRVSTPKALSADDLEMLYHMEMVLKVVVQPRATRLWQRDLYNKMATNAINTLNNLARVLAEEAPGCELATYIVSNVKKWASNDSVPREKRSLCFPEAVMPKKKHGNSKKQG